MSLVCTPSVTVIVSVSVVRMSRMRLLLFFVQPQESARPCPQIDCVSVVVTFLVTMMFGAPS